MYKDIGKFIHNFHICRHQQSTKTNIQLHLYKTVKRPYKTAKRPYDSAALDLMGPLHLSSKENTCALIFMCLLTNYPTGIPIPDKES